MVPSKKRLRLSTKGKAAGSIRLDERASCRHRLVVTDNEDSDDEGVVPSLWLATARTPPCMPSRLLPVLPRLRSVPPRLLPMLPQLLPVLSCLESVLCWVLLQLLWLLPVLLQLMPVLLELLLVLPQLVLVPLPPLWPRRQLLRCPFLHGSMRTHWCAPLHGKLF